MLVRVTQRDVDNAVAAEDDGPVEGKIGVSGEEITGLGRVYVLVDPTLVPGDILVDPDEVSWAPGVVNCFTRRWFDGVPDVDSEDYQHRLAEREAEQLRAHLADPTRVPREIPVDDPEFGTEAWTAAWEDEDDPDEED